MFANLIQQLAPELAAAGKWDDVAAVFNAPIVRSHSELLGTATVISALGPADTELTLAAIGATHTGRIGLAKLAATGLDFSHPLTVGMLNQLQAANVLPSGAAAKLLALGQISSSLSADAGLGTVTAEQCEQAVAFAAADKAAVQLAALRDARITSIAKLDAAAIVGTGELPTLDAALASIKTALASFGAWE